jgi:hypothetical protein
MPAPARLASGHRQRDRSFPITNREIRARFHIRQQPCEANNNMFWECTPCQQCTLSLTCCQTANHAFAKHRKAGRLGFATRSLGLITSCQVTLCRHPSPRNLRAASRCSPGFHFFDLQFSLVKSAHGCALSSALLLSGCFSQIRMPVSRVNCSGLF